MNEAAGKQTPSQLRAYHIEIATPLVLLLLLYSAPPLGMKLSDLCNDPWWWNTRMMAHWWASHRETILMIYLAILIQYTRVTDRWTDRQTGGQTDEPSPAWIFLLSVHVATRTCLPKNLCSNSCRSQFFNQHLVNVWNSLSHTVDFTSLTLFERTTNNVKEYPTQ